LTVVAGIDAADGLAETDELGAGSSEKMCLREPEMMDLEKWRDPSLSFSIEGIEPGYYWSCWLGEGMKKGSLGTYQPLKKLMS